MTKCAGMTVWRMGLIVTLVAAPVSAEPLSSQDREEITRIGSAQGRSPSELNPLLEQVGKAGERGLPTESLLNKVREGLAKGIEPGRIDPVLRQMTSRLESAREVLEEAKRQGMADGNRQRALETMAEAFTRGATADEVRELNRLSQEGRHKPTQEDLAAGAKGLAVMKEGGIPSKDGTALIGEGMRQGFRPSELLDLGREVKRHGSDFEEGRASLQQLRDQVRRGDKSDRLFREDQKASRNGDRGDRENRGDSERGRSDRQDRSGHGDRQDRIDRPDQADRGDRPDRPDRIERSERPDHSGRGRD